MEIFGIGPLELLFIFLIILVVLGPKEMVNGSRKLAAWIRKLRESDLFKTTKEIARMPEEIMKETGLQDEMNKLKTMNQQQLSEVIRDTVKEVDQQELDKQEHLITGVEKPDSQESGTDQP